MKTLIIILSVHIYVIQTKLLYLLNGGSNFSYLSLDEQGILSIIFAISYSIATAIILYKQPNPILIYLYAFLDAMGVLLYYFTKIPLWIGAFYFMIYTFCIISSTIAFRIKKKDEGFSQRKLAEELGVSESKISRALKKVRDV
jgi:hypothetical protein